MRVIIVKDEGLAEPLEFPNIPALQRHVEEQGALSEGEIRVMLSALRRGASWADRTTSYEWRDK